jgi:hypothetical protein
MILDEHRMASSSKMISDDSDFVDVLLSLEGDEKLQDDDIIAILWVCALLYLFFLSFISIIVEFFII